VGKAKNMDCGLVFVLSIIAALDKEEPVMPTTTNPPTTYGSVASLAQFSVARYQRMVETGILTPEDKVELLENYVVLKMPRNPPHDNSLDVLTSSSSHRPSGWRFRRQSAVALADSQPEPDFAFVRGTLADYENRHPGPTDVGLVIEVAIPRCFETSATRRASMRVLVFRATGS